MRPRSVKRRTERQSGSSVDCPSLSGLLRDSRPAVVTRAELRHTARADPIPVQMRAQIARSVTRRVASCPLNAIFQSQSAALEKAWRFGLAGYLSRTAEPWDRLLVAPQTVMLRRSLRPWRTLAYPCASVAKLVEMVALIAGHRSTASESTVLCARNANIALPMDAKGEMRTATWILTLPHSHLQPLRTS